MIRVEGVEYTPEAVEEIRQHVLIPLRDAALRADPPSFNYAVGLSHVIAYMSEYGEMLSGNEQGS